MTSDPSDADPSDSHSLPLPLAREIDRVCDTFGAELRAGKEPRIVDFLGRVSEPARSVLLRELILTELEYRRSQGKPLEVEAFRARFPDDRGVVDDALARLPVATVAPGNQTREAASAGGANLNLLFGIIALQSDFLNREQLVAGFDAWVHDKSRTLADILQSQGVLSAEDREILERLVAKFLDRHGGDPEKSLASLSAISQVRPELEQLCDADLAASLTHVGTADSAGLEKTVPFEHGSPRGRFRILRPHAKGGLGQVSVALDQDLNREVALKEIQPKHADDPISRERFLLEAEITGGLEHPGIVPVYALGQGPDGRPFYAMRFVKGDSLKQAIEDFHRPDHPSRRDPGARQLALRQLLGRFIDVCNAMEYAHSRGVLHRDLKPGNIMVGRYGETLVVDWGLAKAVGKNESISDEATLRPSSALSSSGRTQAGTPVGTPAYMSPEQAAGKLEVLGPASDVYSLGATLYHLLCGRPPFEKQEYSEVVVKVQRGDFPRPRSIERDVPVPLEAICLKAMALQPADRYQSARLLADDLEHWLADEPVSSYREPPVQRLSRWVRWHPKVTTAIAVLWVVGLVLLMQPALALLPFLIANLLTYAAGLLFLVLACIIAWRDSKRAWNAEEQYRHLLTVVENFVKDSLPREKRAGNDCEGDVAFLDRSVLMFNSIATRDITTPSLAQAALDAGQRLTHVHFVAEQRIRSQSLTEATAPAAEQARGQTAHCERLQQPRNRLRYGHPQAVIVVSGAAKGAAIGALGVVMLLVRESSLREQSVLHIVQIATVVIGVTALCGGLLTCKDWFAMAHRRRRSLRLLGSRQPSVRQKSAQELGQLGAAGAPAIPLLLELLKDSDRGVRISAIDALGNIGIRTTSIAGALEALFDDADIVVASAAVNALAKIRRG